MLKAFKYKLNLNQNQKTYFDKTFDACRLVYNLALQTKIQYYQSTKKSLSGYDLIKQLPDLKKDCGWLKEPANMCLQQSILNMDNAYKRFYKGAGFPKFKKKSSNQSCKYTENFDIDFNKNKILIPKIGWIKFSKDREFLGKIKSITISKNACNYYFASILVDTETVKHTAITKKIGIDLGLKDFLTTSDGDKITNPKYLKSSEILLKKHQKRLNKKDKGSNRYNKQKLKIAKIHYRITNQRKDFLHKLSTKLINDNQIIYLEDLNISGMIKNHCLAKAISDVSWSEFVRQLKYKADWYGRQIIQIGRFEPTSKKCNCCGWINHSLTLDIREWSCLDCGVIHDRDINAAINILKTGAGSTKEDVELSTIVGTVKRQIKHKV